jgi:hypothetical protein
LPSAGFQFASWERKPGLGGKKSQAGANGNVFDSLIHRPIAFGFDALAKPGITWSERTPRSLEDLEVFLREPFTAGGADSNVRPVRGFFCASMIGRGGARTRFVASSRAS